MPRFCIDVPDVQQANLFETWFCRPAQVFSEAALREWLGQLPPGFPRLKGLLLTSDAAGASDWIYMNFTC